MLNDLKQPQMKRRTVELYKKNQKDTKRADRINHYVGYYDYCCIDRFVSKASCKNSSEPAAHHIVCRFQECHPSVHKQSSPGCLL